MKVTQVQDLVNSAIQQTSGQSILLKEDLSNVVDVGSEIFGAESVTALLKSWLTVQAIPFLIVEFTKAQFQAF